jgi:hypothetical protein
MEILVSKAGFSKADEVWLPSRGIVEVITHPYQNIDLRMLRPLSNSGTGDNGIIAPKVKTELKRRLCLL